MWPQEDPDLFCRFVLLVSGLGLGGGGGESLLGTQLLVDVVTGQLGDEGEQCSAAQVSRVILAGNLLSHSTQSRDSITKVRRPLACRSPACPPSLMGRACSDAGAAVLGPCPVPGRGASLCSQLGTQAGALGTPVTQALLGPHSVWVSTPRPST